MDKATEIFRDWLWKIQDEQKISQNKIADKSDVSAQSISRWICGKSTPYLRDVVRIAEAFGYHVEIVPNEGESK
jgi:transcriptional regulator with XRE-family HTH domain